MTEFQVMAGNDLRTGRVVYLAGDGQWSGDFLQALHLNDEAAVLTAEQRSGMAVEENQVVGPYLVKVASGNTAPSHIRERIRYSGPTCLPTPYASHGSYQQIAG